MGTGIINLARNIGASVGIATVTTMLDRRAQFHQARLTEHANAFSAAYHNMLNGLQTKLVAAGATTAHASAQAHGMVYNTIQRQAVMLAFLDNFKMLGVVFFAVIPVLVLMRRPKAPAGGVPVH
jgi:DHA2 family multidrug resistance protein